MTRKPFPFASLFGILAMLLALAFHGKVGWSVQAQPLTSAALDTPVAQAQVGVGAQSSSIMFIENVGQFDDAARFQVRGAAGVGMWLADDAIWLTLLEPPADEAEFSTSPDIQQMRAHPQSGTGVNIRLSFVGANSELQIVPFNRLDTKVSYFIGNDPDQWRPDVPVWGGVRYMDIYPGIDLELAGAGGEYTQRLVVRGGADLGAVRLRVDGADTLALENDRLNLTTSVGELSLPLLQSVAANGAPLSSTAAQPQVSGIEVIAPFSSSLEPSTAASPNDNPDDLLYGTFMGGWEWDRGLAIAADGVGNTYVTGETWSYDFPVKPGAFDVTCGTDGLCNPHEYGLHQDVFVVGLDISESDLVYSTFLGGSHMDGGYGIAVDEAGNAYVTGATSSPEFPTPNGFDSSCGTDDACNYDGEYAYFDAFVVKLNASGTTLTYGTYLGGSDSDFGLAIALDAVGNAYVTGTTYSPNFSVTTDAFDRTYNGGNGDVFVARVRPDGQQLTYATFLGGMGSEGGSGIAVDGLGNAFVTGSTQSSNFPVAVGAFDTSYSGDQDAFAVQLQPGSTELVYSTFLGGSGRDYGSAIAVDVAGSAYVAGNTESSDFPATVGAFDTSYNGNQDAFVLKMTANGTGLIYATFLGGNEVEYVGRAIAVDGESSVCMVGSTESSNFPTTPNAFDTSCGTDGNCNFDGTYRYGDAFVTRLDASGTLPTYSTFLGGSRFDGGQGIAVDELGDAFVTGETYSGDFPTTVGALYTDHNGQRDIFVTKLVVRRYSVSGQVRQANGNPFAGVTVQTDTGSSDVTDAHGSYTLDDLRASTYALTPFYAGYAFWPAIRSVTLPPDTAGQAFTILPSPVSITLMPGIAATLSYNDTQGLLTQLEFPADAVEQITTVTLTPTLASSVNGVTFAGHAFRLAAYQSGSQQSDFVFGAPVTVTIHYSDDDIRVVTDEELLSLWWQGGEWQDAGQTCDPASSYTRDPADNSLGVQFCSSGLFGLFGPTHQVYLPLALRRSP